MAVKVLIKRSVPEDMAKDLFPLFTEMRVRATDQPGYISGETLRRLDKPGESLVISTWRSIEAWKRWKDSPERHEVQGKIDSLLGAVTEFEVYDYGFADGRGDQDFLITKTQ